MANKSIKLKDNHYIDSTGVVHNRGLLSTLLNNMLTNINKCLDKNIIEAYIDNTITTNGEWYNLNFNNSVRTGTKLRLSNGKVYIGAGVSKVRVSACFFTEEVNSSNISYLWFFIKKNNSSEEATSIMSGTPVHFQTVVISDVIVNVTEGDYINVLVNNPNYGSKNIKIRGGKLNTRLFVEVID